MTVRGGRLGTMEAARKRETELWMRASTGPPEQCLQQDLAATGRLHHGTSTGSTAREARAVSSMRTQRAQTMHPIQEK